MAYLMKVSLRWQDSLSGNPGLQYLPLHGSMHTPDNNPTCIIEGLACWLTLCILEKIMSDFTNGVQISFIQTLKLIAFS